MPAIVDSVRTFRIDHTFARVPADVNVANNGKGVWQLTLDEQRASAVEFVLPCGLDEHFVGFGEQFTQVDKRGRVIEAHIGASVNKWTAFGTGLDGGYKVAPLWYSSAGYAAFVHGTQASRIELAVGNPHEVVVHVPHEQATLTIVAGWPADAISTVTELTGRPPLAPPWAYGVWKGARGGHEAVLEQARRLQAEEIGASAIWIDAHYEADTNSGFPCAGSYPLGTYPDIAATVEGLHDLGLRAMTYVNPWLYKGTPIHDEAVAAGYAVSDVDGSPLYTTMLHPFDGDAFDIFDQIGMHSMEDGAAVVDFTNPRAREWWQGLLRRILLEEGFDGWMEDFGESVPPDAAMTDGTTSAESHNRYPLLYHDAASEEIARSKPDAVFFARGGWLGAQALAPAFWPGDQTRDWSTSSGLGSVIPAGISIGLMGVAAWGPDIGGNMGFPALGGGFGGGGQDKELWLRWCQLGAMSPVMRDHLSFHVGVPVDLWTDEETIDCWRRCARWHLALFPYLYSAAHEASATGMPILRGMLLHYPDDPEAWTLTTQYMLGDALLCAPVIVKGARRQRVYLPADTWYDWWTGEAWEGPCWVDIDAPIDRWPVFQRAGTAVALLAEVPLHLNDPCYAAGDFDLDIRVAPGGNRSERRLFDGTVVHLAGADRGDVDVEIVSPIDREWRVLGPEQWSS